MDQAVHDRIKKLQLIEESLHSYLVQKQKVQAQLMEIESAKESLEGTKNSYQIIGNIMVKKDVADIQKDLSDRMERVKVRMDAIEKQEKRLKKEAEELQKTISDGMKKPKK